MAEEEETKIEANDTGAGGRERKRRIEVEETGEGTSGLLHSKRAELVQRLGLDSDHPFPAAVDKERTRKPGHR